MTSADDIEWFVTVEEPMPDCPSCEAAFRKVAAPTKMKEWRTSEFAKAKIALKEGVKEPLKTDDEYAASFGPFSFQMKVLEAVTSDDVDGEFVLDTTGTGCCGLVTGRLRFSVYKKDGVVTGKAQEKPSGCSCVFPSKTKMEKEHTTMFQELNGTFRSTPTS